MPEMSPVPQTPQVDLEQEPFSKLIGQLQDAVGLTLVLQTFFQFEAHRQQNTIAAGTPTMLCTSVGCPKKCGTELTSRDLR